MLLLLGDRGDGESRSQYAAHSGTGEMTKMDERGGKYASERAGKVLHTSMLRSMSFCEMERRAKLPGIDAYSPLTLFPKKARRLPEITNVEPESVL